MALSPVIMAVIKAITIAMGADTGSLCPTEWAWEAFLMLLPGYSFMWGDPISIPGRGIISSPNAATPSSSQSIAWYSRLHQVT